MNMFFKDEELANGDYYVVESEKFAITDRHPNIVGLCEEWDIIKKIKANEDGYFDFSKGLIDIGAEDGNYAMLLDFNRNYCFEPNKRMCCLIHANMYLKDKVATTEVYNVALGERDHEWCVFNGFVLKGDDNGKMYEEWMRDREKMVEKMTLDSYGIRNVGLIKTDTEGFDHEVLKGGIHTIIENGYPPILFECWDVDWCGQTQEKRDRLMGFLKSLGYEILEYWGDHETHLAVRKNVL